MENSFGSFIRNKRTEKDMTLRQFSKEVGISTVYASNIESGKRNAPSNEILIKIGSVLLLNDSEKEKMYDLAADSKNSGELASDLVVYINENEEVHASLRKARRCCANKSDWQYFLDYLSKKYDEKAN
jgi:transcriptional regulator with XRE-family HTH domain